VTQERFFNIPVNNNSVNIQNMDILSREHFHQLLMLKTLFFIEMFTTFTI